MSLNKHSMEEIEEPQSPKMLLKAKTNTKSSAQETNLQILPSFPENSPLAKSSSARCLCSPTTHVGSFRCRHHRNLSGMSRTGSVGSNLSLMAENKSELKGTQP
ncbi:hypothetical protein ACOSQ2_030331 [Xanthoceras sorbifolium]